MINFIEVCNFKVGTKIEESSKNAFILNTCQRTLMIGIKSHPEFQQLKAQYSKNLILNLESTEAYSFLLEVICGLRSKLPGESEIINQFKESYENYLSLKQTNSLIMQFMEKLFQDAKKVRRAHLNDIKQDSYASITRSVIKDHSSTKRILILGTGKMAQDLVKTLSKRYTVYITGRNQDRLIYFNEAYQSHILSWEALNHDKAQNLMSEFSVIINTVSAKLDFLNLSFFNSWQQLQSSALFIDLTSPCTLPSSVMNQKEIYHLDDIFNEGLKKNTQANKIIKNALINIEQIVSQRKYTFTHHNHFCWDELIFN